VNKFLTQFGISDKPDKKHWHNKNIPDDPQNARGIKKYYLSYAGGGKATRSTQLFIAFEDLDFLGKPEAPWEVAFGEIISGQRVVDSFYKGNGDIPPFGKGPDQQKIHNRGNKYVRDEFPHTDFIQQCRILSDLTASHPDSERMPQIDPVLIDLGKRPSEMVAEKDKELNLRQQKAELLSEEARPSSAEEDTAVRNSALTAIGVLIIAIFVLFCLYQYNSARSSPKSQ
jgi:cyclophilin family peptidyl-prolyl cis-trans isomerase